MGREWRRKVRVDFITQYAFSLHLLASEQDHRDTVLGAPIILPDVVAKAKKGFGPLKALLDAISAAYADRRVRQLLLACRWYFTNSSP